MKKYSTLGNFINIIGTTGSGKTSLAQEIAGKLAFKHIELDAFHWGPNWTEPALKDFNEMVLTAIEGEHWVADGNYGKVRKILWQKVDTVIWLDYTLPVILYRLFRRTFSRTVLKKELWNGNRERFWEQFFSRESLFLWAINTYPRRKKNTQDGSRITLTSK